MSNEKIGPGGLNVFLPEGYDGKPVTINLRQGDAKKIFQRGNKVAHIGTIYAPLIFAAGIHAAIISKDHKNIDVPGYNSDAVSELPGIVTFNYGLKGKGNPFIKLDELPAHAIDGEVVTGTLERNTDWDDFQINNDGCFTSHELIQVLKRRAGMFKDVSEVRQLIKQLQTVSVKFETEVEKADDRQGNKEARLKEAINIAKGDLPKDVTLVAPLFYGTPDATIKLDVELDRHGNNVVYSFFCPEFEPTKTAQVKQIIDQEVDNLKQWYTAIEQA